MLGAALGLLRRRRRPAHAALHNAEQRLSDAEQSLRSYRDEPRLQRVLGMDGFLAGLERRSEDVYEQRMAVASLRATVGLRQVPSVSEVERRWPDMEVAERREILGRIIDLVLILPGRLNFADRIMVCPAGTAPRDLPGPGMKQPALRSYEMRRRWIKPSASASRGAT